MDFIRGLKTKTTDVDGAVDERILHLKCSRSGSRRPSPEDSGNYLS